MERQDSSVIHQSINETREHGGINGLTPSEMFLQRLIKSKIYTKKKQESERCDKIVTYSE